MICRCFLLFLFIAVPLHAGDWLALPDQSSNVIAPESVDSSGNVSSGNARSEKGQQLIQWLGTARQHGISIPERNWLQLAADPTPQNIRIVATQFASALDKGMLNKQVYQPGWKIADQSVLASLENYFDNEDLDLVEPALPEYAHFKQHLKRLRWWLANAVKQFPDDLLLEKGDHHASVGMLNQWLMDLDLADGLSVSVYSVAHKKAIANVQRLKKLRVDGQMGSRTRQALIALTLKRIKTLRINMERLRWLPRTLPFPRVWVDIAGFHVYWQADKYRKKKYKAIVGIPSRQTPIFQDVIESITINPPWRVPASIASTNILKKAKKDPSFIKREGFKVYSSWKNGAKNIDPDTINWGGLNRRSFPYRLEQKPGAVNRLGLYKIDSPNAYSVYLHDTYQPKLFKKSVRTLSSGCTRVENIDELISSILISQGMGNRLSELQKTGKTSKLTLRKKIPVYFAYFTAWPQENGRIRFRDDIYKLDDALMARF